MSGYAVAGVVLKVRKSQSAARVSLWTGLVHQSLNHIRNDGMDPREAIRESTRNRIRPIFMSVLTSVLGMLPLVIFSGAGAELYRGIGSVVIGGLLISTVFTLLLVPALFSLVLDLKSLDGALASPHLRPP